MTTVETRPQRSQSKPRPQRSSRVVGYLVAVAINVALIWVVNVAPGWRSLPLLSDDFSRVLGLVTLSFVIAVAINLVYVGFDPVWMKRLGDAVTAGVGGVVMLQLFTIFPFDLGAQWAGWETPFRVLLALGCVGAAIGVMVNVAMLARDLTAGR